MRHTKNEVAEAVFCVAGALAAVALAGLMVGVISDTVTWLAHAAWRMM